MRQLAHFWPLTLLILCAFTISDVATTAACDPSLITGADKADYDYSHKRLQCKKNKYVQFGGEQYLNLKCETDGWKYNKQATLVKVKPETPAGAQLNIECVMPCLAPTATMENKAGNTWKCTDNNMDIVIGGNHYAELTCEPTKDEAVWKDGNTPVTVTGNTVECKAKTVQCVVPTVKGGTLETTAGSDKWKCKDGKKIAVNDKPYDELTCDTIGPQQEWKDAAGATVTGNFECREKCQDSWVKGLGAPGSKLEYSPTNQLSCTDDHVVKIGPALHDHLTCNVNDDKWKDSKDVAFIIGTQVTVDATCVKICITNPQQLEIERKSGPAFVYKYSCEAANPPAVLKLFKSGAMVTEELSCSLKEGWKIGANALPQHKIEDPLNVECKPVCEFASAQDLKFDFAANKLYCDGTKILHFGADAVSDLKCDPYNEWTGTGLPRGHKSTDKLTTVTCKDPPPKACANIKGGIAAHPELDLILPAGSAITTLKCKVTDTKEPNNALMLGGKLVHSAMKCDTTNGWSDIDGNNKGAATDEIDATCGPNPCKDRGTKTCTAPAEYSCAAKANPFKKSDDGTLMNCESRERLYNIDAKSFIESPLRCIGEDNAGNVLDDWYVMGKAKTRLFQGLSPIACVELHCSKCAALTLPTKKDNGVVTPIAGITDSDYAPGEQLTCATATCTPGLWKIKRTGAAAEDDAEEYAGEITCGSDDATGGKWTITTGKKVETVDQAGCITAVTTCAQATPIITTVDAAHKELGFEQIGADPLSDTDNNKCPAGMKILYKLPSFEYDFFKDMEGDSIKCNTVNGLWTVYSGDTKTEKEFERGATVFCAVSNPKPTTTTTPKPDDVCDHEKVCPKPSASKCTGCKLTDEDFTRPSTGDVDKCIVTYNGMELSELKNKQLECTRDGKNWTYGGQEIKDFAAFKVKEEEDEAVSPVILAVAAVGGVLFILVVFVVIFKVFVHKKTLTPAEEETKRQEEMQKRKKKTKKGDNDEILDEVDVEAPVDLQL